MNNGKTSLRILCLEDDLSDRQLTVETLAADGLVCDFQFASDGREFEAALARSPFDLVISDFTLPTYDGTAALIAVKKIRPAVPFILLSGTIGEERAVDFLKTGAADCVLKQNLSRLAPAVKRALREADERSKRRAAEEALGIQASQLRALAARLQASREEERLRISREIHDELGGALTAQKFGLTWIQQQLTHRETASWEKIFEKLDSLKKLADETAGRVRKLCTELRPSILDDLGLVAALEWQAREFQSRTNIEVLYELNDVEISSEKATAIFRIFQEILTNVARHSGAKIVRVTLKMEQNDLILNVTDNGRGISENRLRGTGSLGILGMRERAELLGGKLTIYGKAHGGTTVTVSMPADKVEGRRAGS